MLTQNHDEPIRRIVRAIQEGNLGRGERPLPDWVAELRFDAVDFLDASDDKAGKILSPILSHLLSDEPLGPARRQKLLKLRKSFMGKGSCREVISLLN